MPSKKKTTTFTTVVYSGDTLDKLLRTNGDYLSLN